MQERFTAGFLEDFQSHKAGAGDGLDGPELVRVAVRGLAETLSTRARLLRVFILISTQNDAVLAIGSKAAQEVGMAFRALVRQAERAIKRPDPEAAIDFVYRVVYAACEHRVIHLAEDMESDRPLSWAALVDELSLAAQLYLFAQPLG